MKFNNRPNQAVFISRSVAVMVVPLFQCDDILWVPVGVRSNKVSNPGERCLPCGYIDWDEDGRSAAIRETWEEIGLDLSEYLSEQPWFVQSDPTKDERQNVTLRFGCLVQVDELPKLSIFEEGEVDAAFWLKASDVIKDNNLAFNQSSIVRDFRSFICQHGLDHGYGSQWVSKIN